MKRLLVIFASLLVAIPLAIGVMAGLAYSTTTEISVPQPVIKVMEEEIAPVGYLWHEPVFGGLLYRDFEKLPMGGAVVEKAAASELSLTLPNGYEAAVRLILDGEEIWSGSGAQLAEYRFLNSGDYSLHVECRRKATEDAGGHGLIHYACSFKVLVEPRIELSDEWVAQGDVVALRVFNLPSGIQPTAATDLGEVVFLPGSGGTMTAHIPIGHAREAGVYPVLIEAGDYRWEPQIRVVDGAFQMENIVVESPLLPIEGTEQLQLPTEADRSPAYFREFSSLIAPLLGESEPQQLWDGIFSLPVNGDITVEYGLFTYQSNAAEPLRQTGIGIASKPKEAVLAPNGGKVLYAGNSSYMGNVAVIEHGGGLKSILYFLGELSIEAGDTVAKNQQIAVTGTYTYSGAASVYYEVRLGYETVNPQLVCAGTSKLYHFS